MLVHTISEVKEQIFQWKKEGLTVGLVPTMGALHEGHQSLIKKSVTTCDKTIVSVFVNPIQFGQDEDFDKYPRTLEDDYKLTINTGADMVFAPSADEMYGKDIRLSNDTLSYVVPPFFSVHKLCGKSRVGHFDGVCTVVAKLFNITQADYGFFGQKDAQQLTIIKKFVKDLNFPIKIVACPIVREESGLALSSRNKYLSKEDKLHALALSKILNNIKLCYKKGITNSKALKETAFAFLTEKHELEYLEILDNTDFEPLETADDNTIVLIACKVAGVRLIDNILFSEE